MRARGADRLVPGLPAGRVVRALSPEDRSILALETETVAGHTCKVIVLGDRIDPDLLRTSVASRLYRAPQLCLRLCEVDGTPSWVSDPQLDVRAHVVACNSAEAPDETGLRIIVARLFEQRLDRSRPLWRIDVIPELADGGSALIWRIHHALADGSSIMRIARAALWDEHSDSDPRAGGGRRPPAPGRPDSVAHHRPPDVRWFAREVPQPWLRSPFNGHIGARRSVAFATTELSGLRRVASVVDGATVNDAVLTVVAGGLRRWLEFHHGQLGAVRVKVPVSLPAVPVTPDDERAEPGNRDSFFCLDLPLGSADPLDRLAAIRRATRIRKQGHDAEHLDALMRELGRVPRLRSFAERALAHSRSFAVSVSSVSGPTEPVYVLGAPVQALYSLVEIRERHALRVAVISLGDTLNFGLVADPTLLPDVDVLARDIQDEASVLIAAIAPTNVRAGTNRSQKSIDRPTTTKI
jgi:diacylglycerol O-acyltransferase / wax synthase